MRFDLPFFRAKANGTGTVAIVQFNNGTCFMQTGAQSGPMAPNGGAPFDLKSPGKTITVKLGLPDIGALIAAYRAVRLAGQAVPAKLRAYSSDPNRDTSMSVGLVHKYQPKGGPAQAKTISWQFNADGSFLGLSNGSLRQSVVLGPGDEVLLIAHLERSLGLCLEFAGAEP